MNAELGREVELDKGALAGVVYQSVGVHTEACDPALSPVRVGAGAYEPCIMRYDRGTPRSDMAHWIMCWVSGWSDVKS